MASYNNNGQNPNRTLIIVFGAVGVSIILAITSIIIFYGSADKVTILSLFAAIVIPLGNSLLTLKVVGDARQAAVEAKQVATDGQQASSDNRRAIKEVLNVVTNQTEHDVVAASKLQEVHTMVNSQKSEADDKIEEQGRIIKKMSGQIDALEKALRAERK